MRNVLVALFSTLLLSTGLAAPASVSAVNLPAWIERGSTVRPLMPGQTLEAGDVLRTGKGGRILLTLPEGSQIKLGEQAVFRADNLNVSDGRKSPFSAAVQVLQGAFRFTTGALYKLRQREVDIKVATITAGIRGTDIWGKSDNEKDLVCLLEGSISVAHEGEQGFQTMDSPLDFYVAPKGKPALPIAKVDINKVINEWAPQTEPQAGQGLMSATGKWRLVLVQSDTQEQVLGWYDRLRAAGYPARVRPMADGKYRVSVEQLASAADAKALGERLKAELGVPVQQVIGMGR